MHCVKIVLTKNLKFFYAVMPIIPQAILLPIIIYVDLI